MQLRDFEEAERQFAKATALDPAAAEIWANRGNNQIALGRPDSALEFLTRALALEPNFPEALYNRARLLADAGRAEEALAAYDKCLARIDSAAAVQIVFGRRRRAVSGAAVFPSGRCRGSNVPVARPGLRFPSQRVAINVARLPELLRRED
jgi:tetratricopeptide (TPR) repeat protein